MSNTFESTVLGKLSSIEDRLSVIEEKFDEATSFADSILGDGEGVMSVEGLNAVKETLSSFLGPQMTGDSNTSEDSASDAESLQDLVGSLRSFKDRLSYIKDAIADMPKEEVE
jgi:phage-related protein